LERPHHSLKVRNVHVWEATVIRGLSRRAIPLRKEEMKLQLIIGQEG
jgi:hypothetical protein